MDIILAFSAGLLSFLSPCVLPLIPAYLSYISGAAASEITTNKAKANLMVRSVFFVIGFSIIFILLGVSVSSISKLFSANLGIFKKIGGLLIVVFGLHTSGIFKIKLLYSEKRFLPRGNINKNFGPLFLGMAFAAGWTPCIGPILSTILIYAGSMATIYKGIMLLTVYSLGLAIPFLLSAFLIGNITKYFKKFYKFLPVVSAVSGIMMIIMGILIFTDKLTLISRYFSFINI